MLQNLGATATMFFAGNITNPVTHHPQHISSPDNCSSVSTRGKQDAMAMVQVLVTQPSTALRARLLTRPGFIAAVPISSRMQLAASQSKSAAPEPGQTISVNASSLRSGDALSGHLFLLQGHDAYAPQSDFSTQH